MRRGVAALLFLLLAPPAAACSCMRWDADYIARQFVTIYVAEVTHVDTADRRMVRWFGDERVQAIPITVKVLTRLKGRVPKDGRLFALAPGVMCAPGFEKREASLFMLDNNGIVGVCNLARADEKNLREVRAALARARKS